MLRFEPIRLTCWPALSALSLFAVACDLSSSKEESASMVLFTVLQVSAQVSRSPMLSADLEINGDYNEDIYFDGSTLITHRIQAAYEPAVGYAGTWKSETPWGTVERTVIEFDNGSQTAYVDCPACWTPGISRMVWTVYNDHLYYCEIVFGKSTLAEAKADPAAADPADPTVAGSCGFSYWSRLDPL